MGDAQGGGAVALESHRVGAVRTQNRESEEAVDHTGKTKVNINMGERWR
jgi:hypothetical protein